MKRLTLAFLLTFWGVTALAQPESTVDSLLNYSYDQYSYYRFDKAIESADLALKEAIRSGDSTYLTRADFYKEIALQVKEGDRYDVKLINRYRTFFKANDLKVDEARAHLHLARIYYYFGDVLNELQQYLSALDIYKALELQSGVSAVYSDMCLMYYDQHDYPSAFSNIRKAIEIDLPLGDGKTLHRDYNNLAIIFEHVGPRDSAIHYHQIALNYARHARDAYSIGISLSNIGNNFTEAGNYKQAQEYLEQALRIRDSIGNYRGLAYTHNRLANLYIITNRLNKAKFHAEKSLLNAERTSELKIKRMAHERLVEIADLQGDVNAAYMHYKEVVWLKDSLRNEGNTRQITKMVMKYQYEQQHFADSAANYAANLRLKNEYERELIKKHSQRNISILIGAVILILAFAAYRRSRETKKAKEILEQEKERSDELLLNILPHEVAEELKAHGESEARHFDQVTVLFTDFKEFTQKAEKLSAKQLVGEINACFKVFDEIIEKYHIEKIKTIGDSYMAAGGLQVPRSSTAADVVQAALEMQTFMEQHKTERAAADKPYFEMRVGIHTGPVVAGIVGVKKFQYDIWGDTVNTASRMESHGEVGKVNISSDTYQLIKDEAKFTFENRGNVAVKGKGEMEMLFVSKKNG